MTTFWFIVGLLLGAWTAHLSGASIWIVAAIATAICFFCAHIDKMTHRLLVVHKNLIMRNNLSEDLKHMEEMLKRHQTTGIPFEKCDRAPEGWQCKREKGHAGPCAAIMKMPNNGSS